MSEQYVPTTEQVESCWVYAGENYDGSLRESERELRKQFRAWLAKRDAEVAAKAWDEGHSVGEENAGIGMASLLTGLPAPGAKQNPYRKGRS